MGDSPTYDVILVGGGLANGLLARRLTETQPQLTILFLEQAATLGGNHTWSFYDDDVTPAQLAWLQPFIAAHWPSYSVRFPKLTRALNTGYNSVTSDRFHAVLAAELGAAIRCDATVTEITNNSVAVDGKTLTASIVIDGRGHVPSAHMQYGYQKFLGLEVELAAPHMLDRPIIMDATVPQIDGYRFIYTLPLTSHTLLIEDTRYDASANLSIDVMRQDLLDYAAQQNWPISTIQREEIGVLPITLSGDFDAFWAEDIRRLPCTGLRAGLFHPTTGYSLPQAMQLADLIAAQNLTDSQALRNFIQSHAKRLWRRQRFFRILNRMLFYASLPEKRYEVLQRFYRLPSPLIARFYAGRLRLSDIARILTGKPPVPVLKAVKALFNMTGTAS